MFNNLKELTQKLKKGQGLGCIPQTTKGKERPRGEDAFQRTDRTDHWPFTSSPSGPICLRILLFCQSHCA